MAALPKAQRAVSSALANNAIALLIPCHRVVRENGDTGLYRWGAERKQAILGREQSGLISAKKEKRANNSG